MIGGTVTEVKHLNDRVWINCVDDHERRNDHCAIFVVANENSRRIAPGDGIWWQGGNALWTPYTNRGCNRLAGAPKQRGGIDYDIRIPRIGFSGVKLPE